MNLLPHLIYFLYATTFSPPDYFKEIKLHNF